MYEFHMKVSYFTDDAVANSKVTAMKVDVVQFLTLRKRSAE